MLRTKYFLGEILGPDDVVCLLWIIAGMYSNWYFGILAEVYISGLSMIYIYHEIFSQEM